MELKLLKTIETDNGLIINTYVIGDYSITEHIHKSFTCIYTTPNFDANDFLPAIFADDENEDGIITDFRIQTTSYGTLKVEDAKKFIEAYNEAVAVVEILTDKFITTVK